MNRGMLFIQLGPLLTVGKGAAADARNDSTLAAAFLGAALAAF